MEVRARAPEVAVHEQQLDGGEVGHGGQLDDGGAERHGGHGEAGEARAGHERNDEQHDPENGVRRGGAAGGAGDAARDALLDGVAQEGALLGRELVQRRGAHAGAREAQRGGGLARLDGVGDAAGARAG
ncbi:hypothetical protein FGB62_73g030 [Gracilaria domingensis]|nr:hypothetical protein FGB62_73g030 [Gracilaria domingensis]